MRPQPLSMVASDVVIVAHHENTTLLEHCLEKQGFSCISVRGPYTNEQKTYSRAIRCLINHANAWRVVAQGNKPVIIVEADFVPCVGFRTLPVPFWWEDREEKTGAGRFAWLYSAGSILYGIDECGYPHGHGNATVAYILSPAAARACIDFYDLEITRPNPGEYRLWETQLGVYLRWKKGIRNHIPIYQYGEHGGIPNNEHSQKGVRDWHQADVLWDRLAFLPDYARGSRIRYRAIRIRGWLRGCARMCTLRFYNPRDINSDSSRGRIYMQALAISRLVKAAHWFWPPARGNKYQH